MEEYMREKLDVKDRAFREAVKNTLKQTLINKETISNKMNAAVELIEGQKKDIQKHVSILVVKKL